VQECLQNGMITEEELVVAGKKSKRPLRSSYSVCARTTLGIGKP